MATRFLLTVSGLLSEARIASGQGVRAIAGGGDHVRLAFEIERGIADGARGLLSFGIAGGLKPRLPTGAVIVATAVLHDGQRFPTSADWRERLAAALPEAVKADVLGLNTPVTSAVDKLELHQSTGAIAVDMESHVAARIAAAHQLPFIALRVVADPAERALPDAALVGMKKDGSTDLRAVLKSLALHPLQLPSLVRVGDDARKAFAALLRCRRRLDTLGLGASFGLADLG